MKTDRGSIDLFQSLDFVQTHLAARKKFETPRKRYARERKTEKKPGFLGIRERERERKKEQRTRRHCIIPKRETEPRRREEERVPY